MSNWKKCSNPQYRIHQPLDSPIGMFSSVLRRSGYRSVPHKLFKHFGRLRHRQNLYTLRCNLTLSLLFKVTNFIHSRSTTVISKITSDSLFECCEQLNQFGHGYFGYFNFFHPFVPSPLSAGNFETRNKKETVQLMYSQIHSRAV